MSDEGVEGDIAFIRRTIEGGRAYARGRSADLLVWGLFVAAGYLGTYAYVRHWLAVDPGWIWLACTIPPAIYSFRRVLGRLLGRPSEPARNPMVRALSMLWLGCGISMLTLSFAANWTGVARYHWSDAVVASIIAIAFFAASFLCNLSWMRWVAAAWWAYELALFDLHDSSIIPLLGAVMMLVFLAGPGLVLLLGRRTAE
jgi:hypothetical protein